MGLLAHRGWKNGLLPFSTNNSDQNEAVSKSILGSESPKSCPPARDTWEKKTEAHTQLRNPSFPYASTEKNSRIWLGNKINLNRLIW